MVKEEKKMQEFANFNIKRQRICLGMNSESVSPRKD
jgi:hypothetical protein